MDSSIVWYLSGPMSGIVKFNYPLFVEATRLLRGQGFKIVSPVEMDLLTEATWGAALGRDIQVLADDVGGVILLPGWHRSRGARLEVFAGLLLGRAFAIYDPETEIPYSVSVTAVRDVLKENMP